MLLRERNQQPHLISPSLYQAVTAVTGSVLQPDITRTGDDRLCISHHHFKERIFCSESSYGLLSHIPNHENQSLFFYFVPVFCVIQSFPTVQLQLAPCYYGYTLDKIPGLTILDDVSISLDDRLSFFKISTLPLQWDDAIIKITFPAISNLRPPQQNEVWTIIKSALNINMQPFRNIVILLTIITEI